MKLVVNTNTNLCRIYHYSRNPAELSLLKEINHPENKLKNGDLTSDKPGRYKAGAARAAYSPRTEAKEIQIDNFAREIARELNQERINKEYDELILVAPPRMLGFLCQHINKHVKNLIIRNIEKDLLHLADQELLQFLQDEYVVSK